MVHTVGENMSVSEETSVAVALTRMDGKLDGIQQQLTHQSELMGRNRDDAIRDIEQCKKDVIAIEGRCTMLEKANTDTKATVRTVGVIAGVFGTALGIGASVLTKII